MKLSSQEEYGLRCLLQIARQGDGGSLTIAEMSQREGISAPNVAKIMRILRRAGLVRSTRGKAGGYSLRTLPPRSPWATPWARSGAGSSTRTFCDRHSGVEERCLNNADCSIRPVLRYVQDAVDQVLGQLTLQSLLRPERDVAAAIGLRTVPLKVASRTS